MLRLPGHPLRWETGRNLNVRLTERPRTTRNAEFNNNIAEHQLQTNHRIDWNSAECVTSSTNYYQRIVLESWFTNLEQTPLNRCLQLPAPYKPLVYDINTRQTTDWPTTTHVQTLQQHKTDRNAPITVYSLYSQWQVRLTDSRPLIMTSRLRWPITSRTRVYIYYLLTAHKSLDSEDSEPFYSCHETRLIVHSLHCEHCAEWSLVPTNKQQINRYICPLLA